MVDHAELRRLAEAAIHYEVPLTPFTDFEVACTPQTVLALLDEIA